MLSGEKRYTKSPPKTRSSLLTSKPYHPSHYVPSFSSKDGLPSGGGVVTKKLLADSPTHTSTSTTMAPAASTVSPHHFTTRVVESFSDLSLGAGSLGLGDTRRVHKVWKTSSAIVHLSGSEMWLKKFAHSFGLN